MFLWLENYLDLENLDLLKVLVIHFKRLKGSKAIIIDPLETIVKNTDYIVRMTELNKTKSDTMNIILEAKKRSRIF